jgi:murein DD-endopeptidase MepM/ murein hydrolase activator NlpD
MGRQAPPVPFRRPVRGSGVAVAISLACACVPNHPPAQTSTGTDRPAEVSVSSTATPDATARTKTGTPAFPVVTTPSVGGATGPSDESPPPRPAVRYTFPVLPLRNVSFGPTHHDYPATDIFARCGDSYVAPTSGIVVEVSRTDRWEPSRNDGATRGGLSVTIRGDDGVRYYGSHLREIAPGVRTGSRVDAHRRLGVVGRSGNARSTSCHVHFGISPPCEVPGDWWTRRGVVSPWPYLTSWRRGSQRSPAGEVARWHRRHGCPPAPALFGG